MTPVGHDAFNDILLAHSSVGLALGFPAETEFKPWQGGDVLCGKQPASVLREVSGLMQRAN